jgi:predicted alpha/beta-fold hydrolase
MIDTIGISLGSNIMVKYLGEEGEKTPFFAAVSLANPYDLVKVIYINMMTISTLSKTLWFTGRRKDEAFSNKHL